MTTQQITDIAYGADVIVNGYAITANKELLHVLNLHHPRSSAVFDRGGQVLETTMDDVELGIVARYVQDSFKYLEA